MTDKFRIFRRASGVWYIEDSETREQHSLHTRDETEAKRLVQARNESHRQPGINLQIARAYPSEPIMVHCLAGLSRSPAVALALIVRGMVQQGWTTAKPQPLVDHAVELLLQIRRKARPNVLFLRLCLEHFLPAKEANDLTIALVNHPVLMENRFMKQPESSSLYRLRI